jgi:bacillopeptidase F (M6 metalloprotease family)
MMFHRPFFLAFSLVAVVAQTPGCSQKSSDSKRTDAPNAPVAGPKAPLTRLSDKNSDVRAQIRAVDKSANEKQAADAKRLAALEAELESLKGALASKADEARVKALEAEIAALKAQMAKDAAAFKAELKSLREFATGLESKILAKLGANNLASSNAETLRETFEGHTPLYELKGNYQTLVIPVEFAPEDNSQAGGFDGSLVNRQAFLDGTMQKELFGSGAGSMTTYYKHVSGGKLNVGGNVVQPVRVEKPLSYYGKAVQGANDEHARELVVDALKKVMAEKGTSKDFWRAFDKWDLNDLDDDKNFYEPDGFVDAVILVYAGKSQASCQRTFDPEGKRPGTDDVDPADPRRAQKVDCFNRIWPHRWSVFLEKSNPDAPTSGPVREGQEGPANGFRINEELHAFDYNMQSEYSDISTFTHEFGHSLTLPDTYASSGENNVGEWDVMARNSGNSSQELSGYNKLSLGWLTPKILEAGTRTSLYLGHVNYVPKAQRESRATFTGPLSILQQIGAVSSPIDITSLVPSTGEPVYRSALLRTKPSSDSVQVVDVNEANGQYLAYSGRYDNDTRSLRYSFTVPLEGDATFAFDTIYHIETETNFASRDADVRVVTDYDIGFVKVAGETKEELRTLSGDENFDSLVEKNAACKADEALALRKKNIDSGLSADEKKTFAELVAACQAPVWLTKSYDLSAMRGKTVEIEIGLTTDAGYTEFGLFVDNVRMGSRVFDFESGEVPTGGFKASKLGTDVFTSNQFYLFEYRDPQASFGNGALNKDANISRGGMAMFLPESAGSTPKSRFRVVTTSYQPGVLTWYYNSKFDRRSNSPQAQNGQGYILAVGSEIRELELPGPFGDPSLLDDKGFYKTTSDEFKAFAAAQTNEFKCFAYTGFATYLDGKAPACDGYPETDVMEKIRFGSKSLMFSRKSFNDFLPSDQRKHLQVSNPLNALNLLPSYRTALLTFRPPQAKPFAPLKVYKVVDAGNGEGDKLVLDKTLTKASKTYNSMSAFDDAAFGPNAPHLADPRLKGAVAIVQPKGVKFRVENPGSDILAQYGVQSPKSADGEEVAESEESTAAKLESARAPLVKLFLDWNSETAQSLETDVPQPFQRDVRIPATHVHNGFCGHLHD